jgi:two-component system CheB/CheR fusion protein
LQAYRSSPEAAPSPDLTGEFLVVGIGGSAGALDAFTDLLGAIPADAAVAVVVVQHLGEEHASLLVELLGAATRFPVAWAADGVALRASHVYVNPPKQELTVRDGVLRLSAIRHPPVSRLIDVFFASLADDRRERAIGVLVSGNGQDGVDGLRAIKRAGGLAFAQTPHTAAFSAMPTAAIQSGCIDHVLGAAAIGGEVARLAASPGAPWPEPAEAGGTPSLPPHQVGPVFARLLSAGGVDFRQYKQSTISRRIGRRLMLTKAPDLPHYVSLLEKDPAEVAALYDGLLINVTHFFRDAEVFAFLQERVLPGIIASVPPDRPVRVWVPGCASGEEVYSLSMLLFEALEAAGRPPAMQLFGTDVSERLIARARSGLYSSTDVSGAGAARLERFFTLTERGYGVKKAVRDTCVFARHNVLSDPPFSRMDIISCRNVMIYLRARSQRMLTPLFHRALNPDGVLVLGQAESVAAQHDAFLPIDGRFRIYRPKPGARAAGFVLPKNQAAVERASTERATFIMEDDSKPETDGVLREADRVLLNQLASNAVVVNPQLDIIEYRGDTAAYFAPQPGRPSASILKLARDGLAAEIRGAIEAAREGKTRVSRQATVAQGEEVRAVQIEVVPLDRPPHPLHYLIVFRAPPEAAGPAHPRPDERALWAQHVDQLTRDLHDVRDRFRAYVERHEARDQELRTTNEATISANEELQSTNEELETAKEELQSANEELTTVNEELHTRHLELIRVNNDLLNLVSSVHVPIVMLDSAMRIRRFTPMAEKILSVIPSDVGRPLTDINLNIDVANLAQLILQVSSTLAPVELEVRDRQGHWYSLRIRPYKTSDDRIDGSVLTLVDIDEIKRLRSQLGP